MLSRALAALLITVVAVAGYGGFQLLEATLAADVYRERIAELSADHELLRELYNEAIRRTAVTELRVEDGRLWVAIRTAQGDVQVRPAPFDPSKEIYVDYVVVDGRLWIRRLFDEATPPGAGMLIDPELAVIDWKSERASHGKAAYRALAEGRWVVDVTGDGSLGLTRRGDDETVVLSQPPPVRDYEPVEVEVRDALTEIRLDEAIRALAKRFGAWVRA